MDLCVVAFKADFTFTLNTTRKYYFSSKALVKLQLFKM